VNEIFEALLASVTLYPGQTSISEEQRADIMKLAEEEADYQNRIDQLIKKDEEEARIEKRHPMIWRSHGFVFMGQRRDEIMNEFRKHFGFVPQRGQPSKLLPLLKLLEEHFPVDRFPFGVPDAIKRISLVEDIRGWSPLFHRIDVKTVRKAVTEFNRLRLLRDARHRTR
jgi:hypothetical protein